MKADRAILAILSALLLVSVGFNAYQFVLTGNLSTQVSSQSSEIRSLSTQVNSQDSEIRFGFVVVNGTVFDETALNVSSSPNVVFRNVTFRFTILTGVNFTFYQGFNVTWPSGSPTDGKTQLVVVDMNHCLFYHASVCWRFSHGTDPIVGVIVGKGWEWHLLVSVTLD